LNAKEKEMQHASSLRWCRRFLEFVASALLVDAVPQSRAETDPFPSWNDGATKQNIGSFVGRVTKGGGADFVPQAQRVAVFDKTIFPAH
jgi:hypothetical protein